MAGTIRQMTLKKIFMYDILLLKHFILGDNYHTGVASWCTRIALWLWLVVMEANDMSC